jgi:hypothetical protein
MRREDIESRVVWHADVEENVVWHGDGRYSPRCEACGWEGKPRYNHADTRAAVLAHMRTKRHKENTRA